MPGRLVMKKYFAAFVVTFLIVVLLFILIPHQPEKFIPIHYAAHFLPSFDRDLLVELISSPDGSGQLTLTQHQPFEITCPIDYNGKDIFLCFESSAFSEVFLHLNKPAFKIERKLDPGELRQYFDVFRILDEGCAKPNTCASLGMIDGMPIMLVYQRNGNQDTSWLEPHSCKSEAKKAIASLIALLQNDQNSVVEETADGFLRYLDGGGSSMKVLNKNPLCVRIMHNPEYDRNTSVIDFLETLPATETIFLDLTHYNMRNCDTVDVSWIAKTFATKHKSIRWILDPEKTNKFKGLSPNPSYPLQTGRVLII